MTLQGTVRDGKIVLDEALPVPDGTKVMVVVPPLDAERAESSPGQRAKRRQALAELLAIPDENPGDRFSAADHERVLYGEPE